MAQAASFTGTPLEVLKSSKRNGCRAFKLGNRLDYLEFLKWFWTQAGDNKSQLPEGIASPQDWLAMEKAKREQIKRQQDEGSTMLTADAQTQAASAMTEAFSELERMARELPPAMAGLDAVAIYKRMSAEIERIRKTLKKKFEEVGK